MATNGGDSLIGTSLEPELTTNDADSPISTSLESELNSTLPSAFLRGFHRLCEENGMVLTETHVQALEDFFTNSAPSPSESEDHESDEAPPPNYRPAIDLQDQVSGLVTRTNVCLEQIVFSQDRFTRTCMTELGILRDTVKRQDKKIDHLLGLQRRMIAAVEFQQSYIRLQQNRILGRLDRTWLPKCTWLQSRRTQLLRGYVKAYKWDIAARVVIGSTFHRFYFADSLYSLLGMPTKFEILRVSVGVFGIELLFLSLVLGRGTFTS